MFKKNAKRPESETARIKRIDRAQAAKVVAAWGICRDESDCNCGKCDFCEIVYNLGG